MTEESTSNKRQVTELDIANTRHNLNLIRSQAKSQRIDGDFLIRQLDKFADMLERLEAEQQQRTAARRFEALYNVSQTLGSSLDLQTVLDQVMDAVIQISGAERGFLMLRDDDGGLTVKAARNLDQQSLGSDDFKYSRTIVNQVLDSGKSLVTTNAAEDPRFSGQASIVTQALRSIMATPLRARGNVIGVAYVDSRAIAGLFSADDLAMMDALSGQAAIAIDNALLFAATDEQLAMRIEELQQLRRIDMQLTETLDAQKAMFYTLEWACRLSEATSGHLGLVEDEPHHVVATHHYGRQKTGALPVNLDTVYKEIWQVVDSRQTLMVDSGQYGKDTVLIVPVLRENNVIGVIVLKREDAGTFNPTQQDIVQRLATRAAVAIENARLYDAVREADKAKSEFVGIVAHDLKAPMTSISGYSELMLMQDENLNDRQRNFLQRIQDTVRRMEILVSDLADISRIESGHFLMDETRIAPQSVIQALKDATLPEIEKRRHKFIEKIADKLPELYVDYYRLLQVLTNLITNAYKYTPEGGTITLEIKQAGNRVRFSVSDTGIGISKEDLKKLGTKFWRAEDRETRAQPGTGLGFAITRHLVEQMGSQIDIHSKKNEGSRFTFDVPVAAD